jgi:hypothetical protein
VVHSRFGIDHQRAPDVQQLSCKSLKLLGKNSRVAIYGALAVLSAYALWWWTPLRGVIGRQDPGLVAMLSPPLFNFSAEFLSGSVLEFKVGMERVDLAHLIKSRYASDSVLQGGCNDNVKFAREDVKIDSVESATLLSKDRILCLYKPSKQLSIIFTLDSDRVTKIRVSVVNNRI